MVSRVIPVDPFDLVIFGGTGDLARRKILPGLFRRFCAGQMPADARIIGAARGDIGQQGYQDLIRSAINEFGAPSAESLENLDFRRTDAALADPFTVHFDGRAVADVAVRKGGRIRAIQMRGEQHLKFACAQ